MNDLEAGQVMYCVIFLTFHRWLRPDLVPAVDVLGVRLAGRPPPHKPGGTSLHRNQSPGKGVCRRFGQWTLLSDWLVTFQTRRSVLDWKWRPRSTISLSRTFLSVATGNQWIEPISLPLHWFSVVTALISRLSSKMDRGLNTAGRQWFCTWSIFD